MQISRRTEQEALVNVTHSTPVRQPIPERTGRSERTERNERNERTERNIEESLVSCL